MCFQVVQLLIEVYTVWIGFCICIKLGLLMVQIIVWKTVYIKGVAPFYPESYA